LCVKQTSLIIFTEDKSCNWLPLLVTLFILWFCYHQDCTATIGRVTDGWWLGRKWSWPNWGIILDFFGQIEENHTQCQLEQPVSQQRFQKSTSQIQV
jgi:hypothetical protein